MWDKCALEWGCAQVPIVTGFGKYWFQRRKVIRQVDYDLRQVDCLGSGRLQSESVVISVRAGTIVV